MVTYSILAGLGFGIGLGALFGLTAGVTTAVTASIELNREARHLPHYSLTWQALFAAIRSVGFGAGLYPIVGFQFAAAFAVLNAVGQVFAYSRGVRPGMDYSRSRRPLSHAASVFEHCGPKPWLHRDCVDLQRFCPSRGSPAAFCASGGAGDGDRHRVISDGQSLHRILRGQSSGADPGSFWRRTHALRLCAAIAPVLAGAAGCPRSQSLNAQELRQVLRPPSERVRVRIPAFCLFSHSLVTLR